MQVLAFPCSQFLEQEAATEKEIIEFARVKMGANFPLMKKCDVNGETAHPVFKKLRKTTECFYNKQTKKIKNIPWNFCKFILDSDGKVLAYQNPRESLYNCVDEIEAILGLKGGDNDAEVALATLKK